MRRGEACAVLAVLASLLGLLLAAPAAAVTEVTDRPLIAICDGSDSTAGTFRSEESLEVEQASGDIYVFDRGKRVLDKLNADCEAEDFAATGGSSLEVPSEANPGGGFLWGDVALDNSPVNPGRIYLVAGQSSPISAFGPDGGLLWQIPFGVSSAWCGDAVDGEGHLWAIDLISKEVREYSSGGTPPAQIGSFPYANAGIEPCSLDFDAAGDAYVAAHNGGGGVFRYAKNGEGKYEYEAPPLDAEESGGVAVDRESGHVFVSHAESFSEYDSGGAPVGVGSFGKGVLMSGTGIAYNHALDRVYVAGSNFAGHKVYLFGPEATGVVPDVAMGAASEEGVSKATVCGTVNANGVPNEYFFEWKQGTLPYTWIGARSSPPQSVDPLDSEDHEVCFGIASLSGNATYQARLVGLNDEAGTPRQGLRQVSAPITFTTKEAKGPPIVTIDPVQAEPTPPCETGIGTTGACVSGTVDPREDFSTTWWLETSTAYPKCLEAESKSPFVKRPVHQLESEADSAVEVHEELTGLLPSQRYCVRIAALNSANATEGSSLSRSEVEQFETEPVPPDQVLTAFAAPRTQTTARLNAYANPEGETLTYRFEYSADGGANWIELGEHEDTSEARRPLLFAAELSGLEPEHSYSYRFAAENAADEGTPAAGGEKDFATRTGAEARALDPLSCPNAALRANRGFAYLPECRAMELLNNPQDGNQNVSAEVLGGTPPLSADGDRALWNVNGGAPGANSGAGATFLAKRTGQSEAAPTGWASCSLVPPAAAQIHAEDGSYALLATTPDLSRFLFLPGLSESSRFTETLVRLGECGEGQEALRSYDGPQAASNSDLSVDGAHVFHVDQDDAAAHPEADQLEDIGTPGAPEVLSYLPDGSLPECGVADAGEGFSGPGDGVGASGQWRPGYQRLAAGDGSRAYFQVHPNGGDCAARAPWQILERNREASVTLEVAPPDTLNALIRATPDGRSVYFASPLALDPADTNAHLDAYRWEEAPDGLSGASTCLTCGIENEAGEAIVDASLRVFNGAPTPVLVSDDFSHLYFESEAKLAPQAFAGKTNVYALSLSDGRLRFVATPGGSEATLGQGQETGQAELSADGEALVFEATVSGEKQLSADALAPSCPDLRAGGTAPCRELFRYDDRDGSLECLSCLHAGTTSAMVGSVVGSNDFKVSADGETVAFVTSQALTPRDVNRGSDLYEWRDGERRLLTDGRGNFNQRAAAALQPFALSAEGRDILFKVVDPGLTGFEANGLANLYDARIGGGFEVPPPLETCTLDEESCQGPLQPPPPFAVPGSAVVEGAGNPIAPRNCSAPARRAARLDRRARALRRRAASSREHRRARALRRRARRYAHRVQALSKQARRCRRARRAAR